MKNKITISIITTVIVYLAVAFFYWDIAWILQVPNYKMEYRGIMILMFICKCLIDSLIYTNYNIYKK